MIDWYMERNSFFSNFCLQGFFQDFLDFTRFPRLFQVGSTWFKNPGFFVSFKMAWEPCILLEPIHCESNQRTPGACVAHLWYKNAMLCNDRVHLFNQCIMKYVWIMKMIEKEWTELMTDVNVKMQQITQNCTTVKSNIDSQI